MRNAKRLTMRATLFDGSSPLLHETQRPDPVHRAGDAPRIASVANLTRDDGAVFTAIAARHTLEIDTTAHLLARARRARHQAHGDHTPQPVARICPYL